MIVSVQDFPFTSEKICAIYEYDNLFDHPSSGNFGSIARELAFFKEWLASALSAGNWPSVDGFHGDHGRCGISRGAIWHDGWK